MKRQTKIRIVPRALCFLSCCTAVVSSHPDLCPRVIRRYRRQIGSSWRKLTPPAGRRCWCWPTCTKARRSRTWRPDSGSARGPAAKLAPLVQLMLCSACLAQAQLFDGRHCDTLASATEALAIAQDTGQPQWASDLNGIMAYLAAVEGDQERCRQLADAALAEPASAFTSAARPWVHWALGLLDLGRGHPDTALIQLETIWQGPARYHASALRSIPDLVEAAVRLGQPERATQPLARFSAWALRARTPGIDALAERCHALLEAGEKAEQHYLAALKLHNESFEQARTQLLYGAWQRRCRRKADARIQLRAAVNYLERSGAVPWAEQARAELTATGAPAPRPDRAGLPRLTPQELQVARLAAQGLSNRDIAAQLFLSPRTVGYHLYKAYPKLGITSRSELDPHTLRIGPSGAALTQ